MTDDLRTSSGAPWSLRSPRSNSNLDSRWVSANARACNSSGLDPLYTPSVKVELRYDSVQNTTTSLASDEALLQASYHDMTTSNSHAKNQADGDLQKHSLQHYPSDIQHDLDAVKLPQEKKDEILTCAYQYTRCIIPQYTNRRKDIAFTRTIIIGTIAEFRGELVDVTAGDNILGFDLAAILADLFEGSAVQCVRVYYVY